MVPELLPSLGVVSDAEASIMAAQTKALVITGKALVFEQLQQRFRIDSSIIKSLYRGSEIRKRRFCAISSPVAGNSWQKICAKRNPADHFELAGFLERIA